MAWSITKIKYNLKLDILNHDIFIYYVTIGWIALQKFQNPQKCKTILNC